MIVKELIAKLQEMPEEFEVKFQENRSDLLYGMIHYTPRPIKTVTRDENEQVISLWE